jgi:hypothetical protein
MAETKLARVIKLMETTIRLKEIKLMETTIRLKEIKLMEIITKAVKEIR